MHRPAYFIVFTFFEASNTTGKLCFFAGNRLLPTTNCKLAIVLSPSLTTSSFFQCVWHDSLQDYTEWRRGECKALSSSKWCSQRVTSTAVEKVIMVVGLYRPSMTLTKRYLSWTSLLLHLVLHVERLFQVHEDRTEILLMWQVLLTYYYQVEDLLYSAAACFKICLFFSVCGDCLFNRISKISFLPL